MLEGAVFVVCTTVCGRTPSSQLWLNLSFVRSLACSAFRTLGRLKACRASCALTAWERFTVWTSLEAYRAVFWYLMPSGVMVMRVAGATMACASSSMVSSSTNPDGAGLCTSSSSSIVEPWLHRRCSLISITISSLLQPRPFSGICCCCRCFGGASPIVKFPRRCCQAASSPYEVCLRSPGATGFTASVPCWL